MNKPAYIVLDVETTGLHFMRDRLHGLGCLIEGETSATYYLWDAIPPHVTDLLADPSVAKVGHNLHAFDAKFIRRAGFQVEGEFDDTMVIWNLVDSDSPLGLKLLTEQQLGKRENLAKKAALDQLIAYLKLKNIADLTTYDLSNPNSFYTLQRQSIGDVIGEYCCEDVENTHALYLKGLERLKEIDESLKARGLKKSPLDYYYEEARPLERVLFEIEYRGVRIDKGAIERIKKQAQEQIGTNLALLNGLCGRLIGLTERGLEAKLKRQVEQTKNKKPLKNPTPAALERRRLAIENGKAKFKAGEGECKFSWQNSGHVAQALFVHGPEEFKSHVKRTKSGAIQLDKGLLAQLESHQGIAKNARHVLRLFLDYKKWLKIDNTYAGNDETGIMALLVEVGPGEWRVYPKYRQTTSTGRLACSSPNMQNMPRDAEVKRFFIPDSPDLVFDDADYSQIELRIAADHSGDRTLIESYLNEEKTGQDTHCLTASRMFRRHLLKKDCKKGSYEDKLRQAGKRTNFLTIFKGKAPRLRASLFQDTGIEFTNDECKEFIEVWFETYPEVKAHLDRQFKEFHTWHCVVAPNGRMRRLPDIRLKPDYFKAPWDFSHPLTEYLLAKWKKKNPTDAKKRTPNADELGSFAYKCYAHAEKSGYNQPIQGCAGSLTKKSLIALHRAGLVVANTVHDSIVIARKKEDTASRDLLIGIMESIEKLRIPIKVETATLTTFHPEDVVGEELS